MSSLTQQYARKVAMGLALHPFAMDGLHPSGPRCNLSNVCHLPAV